MQSRKQSQFNREKYYESRLAIDCDAKNSIVSDMDGD